jgi:hypothetical protein
LHEANIHTHTNGMTGWGIASVIYPQGNLDRFTCYTYDGFDKLSDTMNYLRFSSPENEDPTDSSVTSRWEQINAVSKMDTIMPDGFQRRIIYELVLSVGQ